MSKSSIEHDIDQAIDFLDDIDRAQNDDAKLKRLARDADDFAQKLKRVRDEVHRHWES